MCTLCGSFEDKTKQVSDIGPISRLSYTEQEAIISHTEERMSIRSSGLFLWKSSLYPTKELFHSLVLFFPFEIDYTTIDSRRSSL